MKMFYNMSARDRSLLILLLAAVIFYLSYTFVMSPALEVAEVLETNIQATQAELDRAEDLMNNNKGLQNQEKMQRKELTDKYSVFLTNLNQARILNRVDTLMISVGLPASSYTPTPEVATQVLVEQGTYMAQEYPIKGLAARINIDGQKDEQSQEGSAPADAAASEESVESEDMIPVTDVSVGLKDATYESVFGLIGAMEKMNKTVNLKTIDITRDEFGLQGQLTFSFYSLPPIDEKQTDGLDFTPALPKGKANPFN